MPKQWIADSKLRAALELYMERRLAELPEDGEGETYAFSSVFRRKMERLIRIERLPFSALINTAGKRVAALLIAACLALVTTVCSVKALREPVFGFFIEIYETFSRVRFQRDGSGESDPNLIEQYYTPQFIPDGFTLVSEVRYDVIANYEYCDSDGRDISFDQSLRNTSIVIDTEGTVVEDVTVNGIAAIYYRNKGYDNLIWSDKGYVFTLSGPSALGKSEIMRMAESVQ